MEPNAGDEHLMRRFLVGRVSLDEQEWVEERFMTDPEYFDALCALEDEMILAHTRGELPEEWREGFRERVLNSPARRRHVQEMERLVDTVSDPVTRVVEQPPARVNWWTFPRFALVTACAAAVVAIVAVSLPRPETADVVQRRSPGPSEVAPPQVPVATFILLPGLSRDELRQANVFRKPESARQVALEVTLRDDTLVEVHAAIRPVGGAAIPLTADPEMQRVPEGVRVTWIVPADLLPRGDYLLTIVRTVGDADPVATRFFTIDE